MEGNLLEYPIFSMERRRVNKETEEYIWKESNIIGKETGEKKFRVSCTLGIPNAFDFNIYNAVMRLYTKKSGAYKKNEVHFTVYEIAKELNLSFTGLTIKRIKESLIRMSHTTLLFENAFFEKKENITKVVHLLVQLEYYEKQKGNRLINMVKIILDDELVNSIERKYFNLIDFKIFKTLSSGIPRKLYEYIEKKKYRKNYFEIGTKNLAKRIGLKTSKISQLKELLGKANDELKKQSVIDQWKFSKENIVYYFKKSERFKEVEEDLFHLENLVKTFYETLGQKIASDILIREGMTVLQDLIDEGFNTKDIEYTLGWAVDNVKGIHSIRILPKVIGKALGDKESKELIKKREDLERKKIVEEKMKLEEEIRKEKELNTIFENLSQNEKEELEKLAKENLIDQGITPEFFLPTMVRIERNKILEQKKLMNKKIVNNLPV